MYLKVIFMVGNKSDLDAQRDVTFDEAKQFAEENGKCCCFADLGLCFEFSSLSVLQINLFTVVTANILTMELLSSKVFTSELAFELFHFTSIMIVWNICIFLCALFRSNSLRHVFQESENYA